jgi:hypothetical protein
MNVWKLVRKDLRLQWRVLVAIVLFELASVVILLLQLRRLQEGVLPLTLGIGLIGGFIFCYRTVLSEEKNRALLFVKGLPVSTQEIAGAKFVANGILVAANLLVLVVVIELCRQVGWLEGAGISATMVVLGLSLHLMSNGVFLAIALMVESDKAVWFAFPLVWVAIHLMANFRRVSEVVDIEALVRAVVSNPGVVLLMALLVVGVLARLSGLVMERRQVFG